MKRMSHLALFVSLFLSLFKCIFISHLCQTVAFLKMTVALPSKGIHSTRLNVRSDVAHLRTFFSIFRSFIFLFSMVNLLDSIKVSRRISSLFTIKKTNVWPQKSNVTPFHTNRNELKLSVNTC